MVVNRIASVRERSAEVGLHGSPNTYVVFESNRPTEHAISRLVTEIEGMLDGTEKDEKTAELKEVRRKQKVQLANLIQSKKTALLAEIGAMPEGTPKVEKMAELEEVRQIQSVGASAGGRSGGRAAGGSSGGAREGSGPKGKNGFSVVVSTCTTVQARPAHVRCVFRL